MISLQNCTVKDFLQMIENTKLICFCAGQKLYELCERFHLADQILYVVDNFKSGQVLDIDSIKIPVRAMNELDEECHKAVCVITSMGFADEMIQQLDALPVCNDLRVYVYELLKEDGEIFDWKQNEPLVIPKKIHYCWFGSQKMPEYFKENIETWRRYCPDYEIIEWNEKNYDVSKNDYMYQAYQYNKWGFVPDYARLDIINTYGGIYLDTDVQILKPFDVLLQYGFFCGFENSSSVNFGQGFGAVPNHPVIQDMLNQYEKLEFIQSDGSLNMIPSPIYQTEILEKWGLEKNGQIQQTEHYLVLSSLFFSPVNEFGFGIPTADTFSIHQYAATWYDEEQRKRKEKIIHNYEMIQKRIG